MSKKKTIECHDCASEVKVVDTYEELNIEDIKFCPLCGSENIEVCETGAKNNE